MVGASLPLSLREVATIPSQLLGSWLEHSVLPFTLSKFPGTFPGAGELALQSLRVGKCAYCLTPDRNSAQGLFKGRGGGLPAREPRWTPLSSLHRGSHRD